jgi:zinc ribbon protein
VTQCRQCGADLPDEAKFCHQCGATVQVPEPVPAAPLQPLEFLQPALAGGMFLALTWSVPIINFGNALCCMWVLMGGGIAAFMVSKQRPAGITYGDGAFAGVLSGLVGAVFATLLSIPIQIISARIFGSQQQAFEEMMKDVPGFEGPMKDLLLEMASPQITAAKLLFVFISDLLIFALFAMVGGILTVAILNKRKQAGRPVN